MGIFLKITSDSYGGETVEKADINNKVLHYITDALNDYVWQDSIAPKLRKINAQYSHITLGTILRFYLLRYIEVGNLKSFARYIKKDDKLIIDQLLVLNKYETLSEDETRKTLCDDIFLYFKEIILKYKDRFQDFDAVMFIPLLEERFEEIKEQKFISNRNPTKI